MAVFIVVLNIVTYNDGSATQGFGAGIFAVFLTHAVLIPKVLWNFVLDRVRELGKALRGED